MTGGTGTKTDDAKCHGRFNGINEMSLHDAFAHLYVSRARVRDGYIRNTCHEVSWMATLELRTRPPTG